MIRILRRKNIKKHYLPYRENIREQWKMRKKEKIRNE